MRDVENIASARENATRALDEAERADPHVTAPNAIAAAGEAAIRRMIVATPHSALNLRSGPEFGQNVIGHLDRGQRVEVETGEPVSGFLHLTDAHRREGWAAARYLRDDRGTTDSAHPASSSPSATNLAVDPSSPTNSKT